MPFANEDEKESEGPWQRAAPANRPIRFVQNGVKRRRKTSKLPDVMKAFMTTVRPTLRRNDEQIEPPNSGTEPSSYDSNETTIIDDLDQSLDIVIDNSSPERRMEFPDSARGTPSSTLSSTQDSPSQSLLPFNDPNSPADSETQWQGLDSGQIMQFDGLVPAPSPNLGADTFTLSAGPLFSSPAQKAAAILDMYDQEFCILPLTTDCLSNPFRIRQESCEGSAFLLHAMLAISSQHLAKKNKSVVLATETWNHHATALRLFSEALDRVPASTLLDTLLLLVNFEATQSASSTWAVHIGGAQKLLESMGGVKVCQRGSRARAQVAMIVWWDVTVAMISRKRPLLDLKYLEYLMVHGEEEDNWTFFGLNGCPAEFIMFMARLSILAATYETVQTMEWVTFSTVPVEAIMAEVQAWTNPEDVTAESIARSIDSDDNNYDHPEDDPDTRRTRFHCIEAWRHAILLYAHRVFYRPQTAAGLRSITHLARVVLDHVRCIPQSDTLQKQTLLPLFLAAAETGDEATRNFARGYCAHWTAETRYSMIGTVEALLESIWADWLPDTLSRRVYWWGTKVASAAVVDNENDSNAHHVSPGGDGGLVSELLFG